MKPNYYFDGSLYIQMLKTAHGWGGVDQILGVNMIFHHFRNALVRICTCSYIHRSYARRFYKFKCWGSTEAHLGPIKK